MAQLGGLYTSGFPLDSFIWAIQLSTLVAEPSLACVEASPMDIE